MTAQRPTWIEPRRRHARWVAPLVLVALALAGCGGEKSNGLEGQTPSQIGATTVSAFREAESVRVAGSVTTANGDVSTQYDLVLRGAGVAGTVSRDNQRIEIVKIDNDTYVRGGKEYYESLGEGQAASLLADRWVRVTPEQGAAYRYFSLDGLALSLDGYLQGLDGTVGTTEFAGLKSVLVAGTDGTKLWAANTGRPYPLRLEMNTSDVGRLDFSDYGTDAVIKRPADAVDLANIG